MNNLFGTDGFRGRAGEAVTAEHAFGVGRFLGMYYGSRGGRCRAVIGKDTRRSSYMLEYALAAGLTASGADAYIMHVTTTPSVAYAARAFNFDCGIVISASHNAFSDNGIKIINGSGEKLDGQTTDLIEDYLRGGKAAPQVSGERVGAVVDFRSGRNNYAAHLVSLVPRPLDGCAFGLDCANGAAYNIARRVFRALGAKVYAVGCAPDGFNINLNCGSTHPRALCALVKGRGLDAGFAFDGDGDRCICVDERGEVVDGDGILYILARYLSAEGGLAGGKVVATVMSNSGLKSSLAAQGIDVETCGVGDRAACERMKEVGASLGGEQSGHVVIRKVENTGDGIVTALWLAQALVQSGGKFSRLTQGLELLPQVCATVHVGDRARADCSAVRAEAERARRMMGGGGRVLVRASGTESAVRIMAECRDGRLCRQVCARIARAVKEG